MYTEFEAEYKAGGYPSPTYTGKKKFGMNVNGNARPTDVLDEAKQRARRAVARDGCFNLGAVEITKIRLV